MTRGMEAEKEARETGLPLARVEVGSIAIDAAVASDVEAPRFFSTLRDVHAFQRFFHSTKSIVSK